MADVISDDDIDEQDIWNYKSVLAKKSSQKSNSNEAKTKTCKSTRKRKSTKSKVPAKNLSTPKRNKYDGHCPNCQMPFSLLIIQSPNWHYTECLMKKKQPMEECVKGSDCKSIIESHYRKYLHTKLANSRTKVKPHSSKQLNFGEIDSSKSVSNLNEEDEILTDFPEMIKTEDDEDCCIITDNSVNQEVEKKLPVDLNRNAKNQFQESPNKTEKSAPFNENCVFQIKGRLNDTVGKDSSVSTIDLSESDSPLSLPPPIGSISSPLFGAEDGYISDSDIFLSSSNVQSLTCPSGFLANDTNSCDSYFLQSKTQCMDTQPEFTGIKTPTKHSVKHKKVRTPKQSSSGISVKSSMKSVEMSQDTSIRTKQSSLLSFFKCSSTTSSVTTTKTKQTSIHSFFKISSTRSAQGCGPPPETSRNLTRNKKEAASRWEQVDQDSCSSANTDSLGKQMRKCPFYKRIPGTKFVVDAFRYGIIPDCSSYFLTHFHYDHYAGLKKSFDQPIFCSRVTGNLLRSKIKISDKFIHELPLNRCIDVEGTKVTALEANHCPGAVLLLFRLKDGRIFLHTGDFRAHHSMEEYPSLLNTRINQLYLDTTYCDPAYAFPPQEEMIQLAMNITTQAFNDNNRTLFVCGTYTIGKERIFLAIAEALKTKVYVVKDKKTILDCLESSHVNNLVTLTPTAAQVHVLPMKKLNYKDLQFHLLQYQKLYNQLIAFEPTGWTHSRNSEPAVSGPKPKFKKENITVYGIPYSEHSSYLEMKRFVQFIKPDKIIPTVNNGNAKSRQKMEAIFETWMKEI